MLGPIQRDDALSFLAPNLGRCLAPLVAELLLVALGTALPSGRWRRRSWWPPPYSGWLEQLLCPMGWPGTRRRRAGSTPLCDVRGAGGGGLRRVRLDDA